MEIEGLESVDTDVGRTLRAFPEAGVRAANRMLCVWGAEEDTVVIYCGNQVCRSPMGDLRR